jgi:hypothetical protein
VVHSIQCNQHQQKQLKQTKRKKKARLTKHNNSYQGEGGAGKQKKAV